MIDNKHSKPVIGLALGSGASRGWAHLGIIDALSELGIEADVISGCSIGSLVGAAYAAGNIEKLEDWVCSLTKRQLVRFFEINLSLNGFVDSHHMQQFMNNFICDESSVIEDLTKPFSCVATELLTGRELSFTNGSVQKAIWSSISMPGLFPPFKYQGKWLVDGGLLNPVPISLCRALGADIVIAVNLNNDLIGKHLNKQSKPSEKEDSLFSSFAETVTNTVKSYSGALFNSSTDIETPPGPFDTIVTSMNIVEERITRSRLAGDPADILISPRLAHIGLLEVQRGNEAIKEGREAVHRMLPEINFLLEKF